MKNLILRILLLVSFSTTSYAQRNRKVEFRTLCLEQIEGLEKVVIPAGKDTAKNQEVILYVDVSPILKGVFTTNEAVFYTIKPGPDGKPLRVAVGKATMGRSKQQLFLFIPSGGGEGKLPYRVIAYDDDLKSFPLGNIRAINLAPVPVRFVLSEVTIPAILPDEFTRFSHPKTLDEYRMYPVSVEFQTPGDKWVKGQSTNWKADDHRREIVITLEDSKSKQRLVKMFSDFPPWVVR